MSQSRSPFFCLAFVILTFNCVSFVCTQNNAKINVNVNRPGEQSTSFDKQVIQLESNEITFNVSRSASFFIVQVHSFLSNLSFSDNYAYPKESSAHGKSVGLVQHINANDTSYTFYLTSNNATSALVAVNTYYGDAPIPGGCNMIFDVETAPYQVVTWSDPMVQVDVQQAAEPGRLCENSKVKLEMYHMFFESGFFSEEEYYENLGKMMTVDGIVNFGDKVSESYATASLRRYYSNYRGVGEVFAVIARWENYTSAYVPAATFGCDFSNGDASCYHPSLYYIRLLAAVFAFEGLSVAAFGTAFPKVTTFATSSLFGCATVFMMSSQIPIDAAYIALPIALVVVLGFIASTRYGLGHAINATMAGYMVTVYIFFKTFIVDAELFDNDVNFWSACSAIMMVVCCLLHLTKSYISLFISFFWIAIGLSLYFDGVLYYSVLNNWRRTTVFNFNLAIIDSPDFFRDHMSFLISAVLCGFGYWVQGKVSRRLGRGVTDESTWLLA